MAPFELAKALAEDHVVGVGRRMQVDDVAHVALAIEAAEHGHDRRDAAARGDEEDPLGAILGEDELAFDVGERDDRAGLELAVDVGRDLALLDELRRDREEAIGAAGVGGDRVGAPVADAVDVETDAQVLAGLVAGPGVAGADQDRRRAAVLRDQLLDAAAQLAR